MKKNKAVLVRIMLSAIALVSICTYSSAQERILETKGQTVLRIDPENALGAPVSEIFQEVKFIPLETTQESIFGKIRQLEVTEDAYIIFDSDTKSILIFDHQGKYIAKINAARINNESPETGNAGFSGFELLKGNGGKLIKIRSGKSFLFYDLTGKFVRKTPVSVNETKPAYLFPEGDTSIRLDEKPNGGKDSSFYELLLNRGGQTIAAYLPYRKSMRVNDEFLSSGKRIYAGPDPNTVFFSRFYDYSIYRATRDSLYLDYQVIVPAKNSIPEGFMENPLFKGKRTEYFRRNNDRLFGISNLYRAGRFLFFNLNKFGPGRRGFVYDLDNSLLLSLRDLEPDGLSLFLPVTDAGSGSEFESTGFHLVRGGCFYTSYSSLAMFSFRDQNPDKKAVYNETLRNYFKTGNRKSNPVLIMLKPRVD